MVTRKTAVRVVAGLAVLILVGVTALAGGNKSGFATINNGKMTVSLNSPSYVYTAPDPDEANLTKIFSNLGPEGNVYQCCIGWTISAPGSPVGAQQWVAHAFTPAKDSTVVKIKVGVGYVTGTNGVVLAIAKDNNNFPGGFLKSWTKLGVLPVFGSCCDLVKAKDVAGIPLTGGKQYWVVVKLNAKTPDTWDAWNFSNSGIGRMAFNTGSGWLDGGDTNQGAFAVLGN